MPNQARLRGLVIVSVFAFFASIAFVGLRNASEPVGTHDDFWSVVRLSGTGESYDSLAEVSKRADLIVIGRIVAIERGREWLAIPDLAGDRVYDDVAHARLAKATLKVERVVGGGSLADPLEVEFSVITWDQLPLLQRSIPAERSLFFLHRKLPPDDSRYFRLLVLDDGVIRDVNGIAVPLSSDTIVGGEVAGRDFDTLVGDVSALSLR